MEPGSYTFRFDSRPLGSIVRRILIVTVGVFFLQLLVDPRFGSRIVGPFERIFGLSWHGVSHGMIWQLVTYMFLHGGVMHVLMNMFGLFFLGRELESSIGSRRFLILYIGCGILGGIGWLILSGRYGGPCIGASGAVFGIVGAFAALFPHRQLTLLVFFVLPVTMSARTLAIAFGLISLLMLRVDGGGIAHAAHLAGGLAGYFYGRQLVRRNPFTFKGIRRLSISDIRAWWRRRRYKLMVDDNEPVDWERVDRILDKIRAHGVNSLTVEEKSLLDRASRGKS